MNDSEENGDDISPEYRANYWEARCLQAEATLSSINSSAQNLGCILEFVDKGLEKILDRAEFMEKLEVPVEKRVSATIDEVSSLIESRMNLARDLSLQSMEEIFGLIVPTTIFDITDEELSVLPEISPQDTIICDKCGGQHRVEFALDENGDTNEEMILLQCEESMTSTIVGYKGKDIRNFEREGDK